MKAWYSLTAAFDFAPSAPSAVPTLQPKWFSACCTSTFSALCSAEMAGALDFDLLDFDLPLDFFLPFSLATAPPMMAPTISPATTSPLSARAGCGMGERGEMDRATMAAPLAR